MEATIVIELLRDAFSLIDFVQQTAHSIRNHKDERDDLDLKFQAQTLRLRQFSRLFTVADEDAAEIVRLKDVPEENLEIVRRYLVRLQRILVEYKDAAFKDKEYHKNVTLPATDGQSEVDKQLFEKDKLGTLLVEFTTWNDELAGMIPYVLSGINNVSDSPLFHNLGRADEEGDLFAVHIKLQQQSLSRSLKADPQSDWVEVEPMAWEDAKSDMSKPRVLVEYKDEPSSEMVYAQQLEWLLQATGNHKFNTLPLRGFAPDPFSAQYAFLFDFPKESTDDALISLYNMILSDKPHLRMSLKQWFHIARSVAASIGTFHADGWYHKSIRSHAVQFFQVPKPDVARACDFHNPYLTEFESSRPEASQSLCASGSTVQDIERDVYLHPDRYSPPKPFTKVYDIYSLGVLLLEIGLW
ncbi:hypothetical protein B0H67DRAFT_647475 [Lasiosphaeris hirsuta]|uniref:Protein kinase domain-containing protein n=1 Tax=Lasiosphaeris hirsuta TaxID=260670 RepID=A0AA40A115_9PEZI|nr:hypothetical protein B0H67DRAFT_647475 [Lasiosphaeris hirsuta]